MFNEQRDSHDSKFNIDMLDDSAMSISTSSLDSTVPSVDIHPYLEIGKCLQNLRRSVYSMYKDELDHSTQSKGLSMNMSELTDKNGSNLQANMETPVGNQFTINKEMNLTPSTKPYEGQVHGLNVPTATVSPGFTPEYLYQEYEYEVVDSTGGSNPSRANNPATEQVINSINRISSQHSEKFEKLMQEVEYWRRQTQGFAEKLEESEKRHLSKLKAVTSHHEKISERQQKVLEELSAALKQPESHSQWQAVAAKALSDQNSLRSSIDQLSETLKRLSVKDGVHESMSLSSGIGPRDSFSRHEESTVHLRQLYEQLSLQLQTAFRDKTQLEDRMLRLETENSRLLKDLSSKDKEYQRKIEGLKVEYEDDVRRSNLRAEGKEREEMKGLRQKISTLEETHQQRVNILSTQFETSQVELNTTRKTLLEAQKTMHTLQEEMKKLRRERELKDDENKQLQYKLNDLTRQSARKGEQMTSLRHEFNELLELRGEKREPLELSIERLKNSENKIHYDNEIHSLRDSLKQIQSSEAQLRQQYAELQLELRTEAHQQQLEKEELRNSLEKKILSEKQRSQREIEAALSRADSQAKLRLDSEEQLSDLKLRLIEKDSEIDSLQHRNQQLHLDVSRLQDLSRDLQDQADAKHAELVKQLEESSTSRSSVYRIQQQLEHQLVQSRKKEQELTAKYSTAKKGLKGYLKEEQQRLNEWLEDLQTGEASTLSEDMLDFRESGNSELPLRGSLTLDTSMSTSSLEAQTEQLRESVSSQLKKRMKDSKKHENEVQNLHKHLLSLKEDLVGSKAEVSELETQLKQTKRQLAIQENVQKRQLEQLKGKTQEELSKQVQKLTSMLNSTSSEVEKLRSKMSGEKEQFDLKKKSFDQQLQEKEEKEDDLYRELTKEQNKTNKLIQQVEATLREINDMDVDKVSVSPDHSAELSSTGGSGPKAGKVEGTLQEIRSVVVGKIQEVGKKKRKYEDDFKRLHQDMKKFLSGLLDGFLSSVENPEEPVESDPFLFSTVKTSDTELRTLLQQLEKVLYSTNTSVETTSKQVLSLQEEVKSLHQQNLSLLEKERELVQMIGSQETRHASRETELLEKIEEYKRSKDRLDTERNKTKNQLSDTSEKLSIVQTEVMELQNTVSRLQHQLRIKSSDSKQLEAHLREARQKKEELTLQVSILESEIADLRHEQDRSRMLMLETRSKEEDLRSSTEVTRSLHENEKKHLLQRAEMAEQRLESMRCALHTATELQQTLSLKLDSSMQLETQLQGQLNALEKDKSTVDEKLDLVERELRQKEEEVSLEQSRNRELKVRLHEQLKDLRASSERNTGNAQLIANLEARLSASTHLRSSMESEDTSASKGKGSTVELISALSRVRVLTSRNVELEALVADLEETKSRLKSENKGLRGTLKQLQLQRSGSSTHHRSSDSDLPLSEGSHQHAVAMFSHGKHRYSDQESLRVSLDFESPQAELLMKSGDLENMVTSFRVEKQDLIQHISELRTTSSRLQEEKSHLETELSKTRSQLERASREATGDGMNSDLSKTKQRLLEQQDLVSTVQVQLENSLQRERQLEVDLQAVRADHSRFSHLCETQQRELHELKQKLTFAVSVGSVNQIMLKPSESVSIERESRNEFTTTREVYTHSHLHYESTVQLDTKDPDVMSSMRSSVSSLGQANPLVASLENASWDKGNELERNAKKYQEQIDALCTRAERLEEENLKLKHELTQVEETKRTLKARVEMTAVEQQHLAEELTARSDRITELLNNIHKLQEENEKLAQAERRMAEIQFVLADFKDQIGRSNREYEEKIDGLQRELTQLSDTFQTQLTDAWTSYEREHKEKESLSLQIQKLKGSLQETQQKHLIETARLKERASALESLQYQLNDASKRLEQEKQMKERVYSELQGVKSKMGEREQKYLDEVIRLKEERARATDDLHRKLAETVSLYEGEKVRAAALTAQLEEVEKHHSVALKLQLAKMEALYQRESQNRDTLSLEVQELKESQRWSGQQHLDEIISLREEKAKAGEAFQQQLDRAWAEYEKEHKELLDLAKELQEAKLRHVATVTQLKEEHRRSTVELERELRVAKGKVEKEAAKSSALELELNLMRQSRGELEEHLNQVTAELRQEKEDINVSLQQQLDTLTSANQKEVKDREALEKKVKEVESRRDELQVEVDTLLTKMTEKESSFLDQKTRLDEALRALKDKEMMSEEINRLQLKLSDSKREIEVLQAELNSSKNSLTESKTNIAALEDHLADALAQGERFNTEQSSLTVQVQQLQQTIIEVNQQHLSEIVTLKEERSTAAETFQDQLTAAWAEHEKERKERERLMAEIGALKDSMLKSEQKYLDEMKHLKDERSDSTKTLQLQLTEALAVYEKEVKEKALLATELETLKGKILQAEQKYSLELTRLTEERVGATVVLQKQMSEVRGQYEMERSLRDKASTQLLELEEKLREVQLKHVEDVFKLKQEHFKTNNGIQQRLQDALSKSEQTVVEREVLTSEIVELKHKLQETERNHFEQMSKLKEERVTASDRFQQQLTDAWDKFEKEHKRWEETNSELQTVKDQLTKSENKFSEALAQSQADHAQALDTLKQQLLNTLSKLEEETKEKKNLAIELQKCTDQIRDAEQKHSMDSIRLTEKAGSLQRKLTEARDDKEKLHREKEDILAKLRSYEESLREVEAKHRIELIRLKEERAKATDGFQRQLTDAWAENEKGQKLREELNTEVLSLKDQLRTSQQTHLDEMIKLKEERARATDGFQQQLTESWANYEKEHKEKESIIASLQDLKDSLRQSEQKHLDQVVQLKEERAKATDAFQQQLTDAWTEFEREHKEKEEVLVESQSLRQSLLELELKHDQQLKKLHEEHRTAMQDLERQVSSAWAEHEKASTERDRWMAQTKNLQSSLQSTEQAYLEEISQLRKERYSSVDGVQQQMMDAVARLEMSEREREKLSGVVKTLEEKLLKTEQKHMSELTALKQEHAKVSDGLQQQLTELRRDYEQEQREKGKLSGEVERVKEKLNRSKSMHHEEITKLKEEKSEVVARHQEEFGSLQRKVTATTVEMERNLKTAGKTHETSLREKNQQIELLKSQLDYVRTNLADVQQELEEKVDHLAEVEAQLAASARENSLVKQRSQLQLVSGTASVKKSFKRFSLSVANALLAAEEEASSGEVGELRRMVEAVSLEDTGANVLSERDLQLLKSAVERCISVLNEQNKGLKNLKEEKTGLEMEIEDLTLKLKLAEEKSSQFERERLSLTEQKENDKKKIHELSEELTEKTSLVEEYSRVMAEQENSENVKNEWFSKLRNANGEMQNTCESLKNELRFAQDLVNDLEVTVVEQKKEIFNANETKEKQLEFIRGLENKLRELREIKENLDQENDFLETRLKQLSNEKEDQETKISELQVEARTSESKLKEKEEQHRRLIEEKTVVSTEVETLKSLLKKAETALETQQKVNEISDIQAKTMQEAVMSLFEHCRTLDGSLQVDSTTEEQKRASFFSLMGSADVEPPVLINEVRSWCNGLVRHFQELKVNGNCQLDVIKAKEQLIEELQLQVRTSNSELQATKQLISNELQSVLEFLHEKSGKLSSELKTEISGFSVDFGSETQGSGSFSAVMETVVLKMKEYSERLVQAAKIRVEDLVKEKASLELEVKELRSSLKKKDIEFTQIQQEILSSQLEPMLTPDLNSVAGRIKDQDLQNELTRCLKERTILEEQLKNVKYVATQYEKEVKKLMTEMSELQLSFIRKESAYQRKIYETNEIINEYKNKSEYKDYDRKNLEKLLHYRRMTEQKIAEFERILVDLYKNSRYSNDDSSSVSVDLNVSNDFDLEKFIKFSKFTPKNEEFTYNLDENEGLKRFQASNEQKLENLYHSENTENLELPGILDQFHWLMREYRRYKRIANSQQMCILALRLLMKNEKENREKIEG